MVAINCQQYNAPIAVMRKQEKALVHEANHTAMRGDLMVITTRYRHLNSKLGAEIQDQQYCYIVDKEDAKTDKYWKSFHSNGYGAAP
jgi:hypothetical protein